MTDTDLFDLGQPFHALLIKLTYLAAVVTQQCVVLFLIVGSHLKQLLFNEESYLLLSHPNDQTIKIIIRFLKAVVKINRTATKIDIAYLRVIYVINRQ
jgi:hypothetical protein